MGVQGLSNIAPIVQGEMSAINEFGVNPPVPANIARSRYKQLNLKSDIGGGLLIFTTVSSIALFTAAVVLCSRACFNGTSHLNAKIVGASIAVPVFVLLPTSVTLLAHNEKNNNKKRYVFRILNSNYLENATSANQMISFITAYNNSNIRQAELSLLEQAKMNLLSTRAQRIVSVANEASNDTLRLTDDIKLQQIKFLADQYHIGLSDDFIETYNGRYPNNPIAGLEAI